MITISLKVHYSLLALVEIASVGGATLVQLADISSKHDIPVKYLETVLSTLRQSGFIRSSRGAKGGYQLAIDPNEILINDVFRAVEGDGALDLKIKHSVLAMFWESLRVESSNLVHYSLADFLLKWQSSHRLTYTI